MSLNLYQTSSLNKTILNSKEKPLPLKRLSCIRGEEVSYQIVAEFSWQHSFKARAKIRVESSLDGISVREIGNVPSELPSWLGGFDSDFDESYISLKPGIYPDPLFEIKGSVAELLPGFLRSFWVSIRTDETTIPGIHTVKVCFENEEAEIFAECTMEIEVIEAILPNQDLKVTQWFHTDCLMDYYDFEAFSAKYWDMTRKFMQTAVDNGINMILTPIFTPPLDTEIGSERPTVQLVAISKDESGYSFNFDKLKKWIDMANECGVEYFEMAHLFTQWGAKCTPKIVVCENGEDIKKFGWHVAADSAEYLEFLTAFLPALTDFLKNEGLSSDKVYFHISDEPHMPDKEHYKKAREIVKPLIKDFKTFDALSDYELYKEGLVDTPVVGIYRIDNFIDANVSDLWVYYCCSHFKNVSNRFIAQKSSCNRIIGLQLYKYDIKGFLQWGYNFYYSQLSRELINPYMTTDARNAFPSGDPFSVYPGREGAIESIRIKVFKEALQDLRALKLLEQYMPKEEIIRLIEEEAGCEIKFDNFPKDDEFLIRLREKINCLIKEKSAV